MWPGRIYEVRTAGEGGARPVIVLDVITGSDETAGTPARRDRRIFRVVPCTTTAPDRERPTHLRIDRAVATLRPPSWVLCREWIDLSASDLPAESGRGVLPLDVLAVLRNKLAFAVARRR